MASPATSSAPGASSSSTPSGRTRDWSSLRNGEPGSAYRGMDTRGRGRGFRSGPRGGRGGRGGGASRGSRGASDSNETQGVSQEKAGALLTGKSLTKPESSVLEERSPTVPSPGTSKPKVSPGRPARPIPSLTVSSASSTLEVPPTTPTSHSPRRKRGQPANKSSATTNPNPTVDNPRLRSRHKNQAGRTSPPGPANGVPSRLNLSVPVESTSHDPRHDIDALVEHVRAVAMADKRPTTPGSHIDWAGDDDDGLPDLDDWGVKTSPGEKDNTISPIMVATLKTLPELHSHSFSAPLRTSNISETSLPAKPVSGNGYSPSAGEVHATLETSISVGVTEPPKLNPPAHEKPGKSLSGVFPNRSSAAAAPPKEIRTPTTFLEPNGNSKDRTAYRKPAAASAPSTKQSRLHPSLPAKPVVVLPAKVTPRAVTAPAPHVVSPKPSPKIETVTSKTTTITEIPVVETNADLPVMNSADATVEQPTSRPLYTPPLARSTSSSAPPSPQVAVGEGLSASIHAPHPGTPSEIVLNDMSPQPIPTFSHRALGHQSHMTQPSFQPINPRGGFGHHGGYVPRGGYHMRTQSSPSSSMMGNRASPSSRPVITGDAISRLARTIGNSGSSSPRDISPSKPSSVTPPKVA